MAAARKPAHKAPAHEKPGKPENPIVVATAEPLQAAVERAASKHGGEIYVNVDRLSWRPHPLPRGTEVSRVLPAGVIEQCLADGRLTREKP